MRNFLFLLGVATLVTACSNQTKTETNDVKVKAAASLPYVPSYSASFTMGDHPEYTTMIAQGSWKDWENNTMDNMKSWIADSIVAFHSDNTMVQGADSLIARWKTGRAKYSAVVDTLEAVIPVYSTDKKENWVLVWAKEINTRTDGKKDTAWVMETWRINKDGKADMLLQYDRATRKK
ncbi:MAG: hypothetical protein ACXVLT_08405 [Flavisolibacter sp.]